jgi:hypothetical protein
MTGNRGRHSESGMSLEMFFWEFIHNPIFIHVTDSKNIKILICTSADVQFLGYGSGILTFNTDKENPGIGNAI